MSEGCPRVALGSRAWSRAFTYPQALARERSRDLEATGHQGQRRHTGRWVGTWQAGARKRRKSTHRL